MLSDLKSWFTWLCESFCDMYTLLLLNTVINCPLPRKTSQRLKNTQKTIVSLGKERVVKDLQLLGSIAELKSLQNHLNKLINETSETLQWVSSYCRPFRYTYSLYHHMCILIWQSQRLWFWRHHAKQTICPCYHSGCLKKSIKTYISTMTVSNTINGFGTCMNILAWTMMQPIS